MIKSKSYLLSSSLMRVEVVSPVPPIVVTTSSSSHFHPTAPPAFPCIVRVAIVPGTLLSEFRRLLLMTPLAFFGAML